MRPWGKRGFLHWLFFQNPKRKPSGAARRGHSPKLLTTKSQQDSGRYDDWPDPVVAYPVPYGEGVLEANIIDVVESDYEVENVFTRRSEEQDESIIDMGSQELDESGDVTHEDFPVEIFPNEAAPSPENDLEPEDEPFYYENEPVEIESETDGEIDNTPDNGIENEPDNGLDNDPGSEIENEPVNETENEPDNETENAGLAHQDEPQQDESQPYSDQDQDQDQDQLNNDDATAANTCTTCNTPFESTDIFCGRCGTRLTAREAPAVKAFCGHCGAKNEHQLKFCGDCGFKLAYA